MIVHSHYSQFGGLEYLLVRAPNLWKEIGNVLAQVGTGVSGARQTRESVEGLRYSGQGMCEAVMDGFHGLGWSSINGTNWRQDQLPKYPRRKQSRGDDQMRQVWYGHADVDRYRVLKDRVAVELQVGEIASVGMDFRSRYLALYADELIDVGVGLAPTRVLRDQMDLGSLCYEDELEHLVAHQRGAPAVPLVLVGVAP